MVTRAGDIYCEQGETFTIGFKIVNPDGSPFVLSKELEYADSSDHASYLLLTIASAANITGDNRYLANFWDPITKYKKVYSTQAVNIDTVNDDWPTVSNIQSYIQKLISADSGAKDVTPENYAIYYIVKKDGTKEYRQLITINGTLSLEEYAFNYNHYIPKEISNEWSQSGYEYGLKVVSGSKITGDPNGRLINIEFSYPLIAAHKLYVDTNIQGSLELWKDKEEANE